MRRQAKDGFLDKGRRGCAIDCPQYFLQRTKVVQVIGDLCRCMCKSLTGDPTGCARLTVSGLKGQRSRNDSCAVGKAKVRPRARALISCMVQKGLKGILSRRFASLSMIYAGGCRG